MIKLSHIAAAIAWLALIAVIRLDVSAQTVPVQTVPAVDALDPTRDITPSAPLQHKPLPEEYIWTADDAAALTPDAQPTWSDQQARTAAHYFRTTFQVEQVPGAATLYVAGPRSIRAYLNGQLVGSVRSDLDAPIGTHVFRLNVQHALRPGTNVLAIEAVRGRGIVQVTVSPLTEQVAYGEVLVAKLLSAPPGVDGASLLISNSTWHSTLNAADGWQQPRFDDASWRKVQSLGGIESDSMFYQWSVDAGLFDWPGYQGMSSFLRTYRLPAASVSHIFAGASSFEHLTALTDGPQTANDAEHFTVNLSAHELPVGAAPGMLLDFGREINGRIRIDSACNCEVSVQVSYGESEPEALRSGHYLGVNLLQIAPHTSARGPKSGFRYAYLRFLKGDLVTSFRDISAEGIYYPVSYRGSFTSSDETINRIWATGAYTTHLCMQDGIWDAIKRDRGEWIGDLDVESRVVNDVFADKVEIEKTLQDVVSSPPVRNNINNTPSYTAFWISQLAEFYLHSGDEAFLKQEQPALNSLLALMNSDFDSQGEYLNKVGKWPIVDWSPGLHGHNEATREGTAMAIVRGYRDAAYLLRQLGDPQQASEAVRHADLATSALRKDFAGQFPVTAETPFGKRWQLNAMAVLADVARPVQYSEIWERSLITVSEDRPHADPDFVSERQIVSPYYGYYVLEAMAKLGHRREAIDWVRHYWGGMLALGATSFWETYDPSWPQNANYHLSLQADGTSGFFVSLAHGWSSGPTAWLMEQVLGIQPTSAGFHTVTIRPDLVDLQWAKGSEPTPRGDIHVALQKVGPAVEVSIVLPPETTADVLIPVFSKDRPLLENGKKISVRLQENGSRALVRLVSPGTYLFSAPSSVASH